jgi:uncharacterized membrane protein YdjX (TVP38/TMEM64 family)
MKAKKIILILVITVLIAGFFIFDIGQYTNLEFLKARQTDIESYYAAHPVNTVLIFFLTYVFFTGLSLPAASILTLAGGAIFGLFVGTVLVSFASTLGATLAFLASRFLFKDFVQKHFGDKLEVINQGVEKDGAFYLFTMRLVPIFPFFIVNIVMGLTPIRTLTYAMVSQIGMLTATIVFVNAGTQLAKVNEVSDILSLPLIASFILLGLFPLITKKTLDFFRSSTKTNVNEDDE